MDELGFMESGSQEFCDAVLRCLDGEISVLATVKTRMDVDFWYQVRSHPNGRVYIITEENRDELYEELLPLVLQFKGYPTQSFIITFSGRCESWILYLVLSDIKTLHI